MILGYRDDNGNKWLSRVEDKVVGQGQGTKLLIIVKIAQFASDLFTYVVMCFLKEEKE